jgi:hypothetical protein
MPAAPYSLSEIARWLDVPQHRLIHLCEKHVVIPDVHEATGRGSSRSFSPRNYLEFAVALRLRDMFIPVATLRGIIDVFRGFGRQVAELRPGRSTLDYLRDETSPELRIILSDGRLLYFGLYTGAGASRLYGGIPLESLSADASEQSGPAEPVDFPSATDAWAGTFGEPEGSAFVRLELSVNAVARSLQLE